MAAEPFTTAGKKNVPLHPEASRYLAQGALSGVKPFYEYDDVEAAREVVERAVVATAGQYDFSGSTEDIRVPSPDMPAGIRCRVYRPQQLPTDSAIFIYAHGGGQTLCSIESHNVCCMHLADYCKTIIMSVEYRLAPEFKLPAQFEDVECVARWALLNKTQIGGTEKSVVGVGGDSAGGMISAVVCHYVQGLAFQILVYPPVDLSANFSSYDEFENGPVVTAKASKWFRDKFLPDEEGVLTNPRYSPLQHAKFDHLPPALFIVAECDRLRDDSYEYAKKLTEAGIYNELILVKGTPHGFFASPGVFKECCSKAYSDVAKFIKEKVYNLK